MMRSNTLVNTFETPKLFLHFVRQKNKTVESFFKQKLSTRDNI